VVTGATGNVGTAVMDALERDAAVDSVLGLARRLPDSERIAGKCRYGIADVATDDLSGPFDGADAVVHLAWHFQPTHDPAHTWRANAIGSTRVFDAAARAGARAVVYASSVGAYTPVERDGPERDRPVDESWPTHSLPTSCYGREKAYVERVLDAFEARHPEVRVVRMRPAFMFADYAASEQRRIFAGPFVPGRLVAPGRLPLLPFPSALRFQALHVRDAAEAFRAAVVGTFEGPCNLAADPVIDGRTLAELLDARLTLVPPEVARTAIAAGWHLRLVPVEPALFDLALDLPLLDTRRAREELGWTPRHDAVDAVREFVDGLVHGRGAPTPPLAPDSPARRVREFASRIGGRDA
jgi:nucleoside-diphosphate-sugar epimerase